MIYTLARRVYSAKDTTNDQDQDERTKGLKIIRPSEKSAMEREVLHIPDERCYVWAISVDHPSRPTPPDVVRLHVSIGCLVLEPISAAHTVFNSPGTKVTRMVHGDPKGHIPALIVNRQSLNQITGMLSWLDQWAKKQKTASATAPASTTKLRARL